MQLLNYFSMPRILSVPEFLRTRQAQKTPFVLLTCRSVPPLCRWESGRENRTDVDDASLVSVPRLCH